jgi:Bacterial capsule synthesis protein PGA_cap
MRRLAFTGLALVFLAGGAAAALAALRGAPAAAVAPRGGSHRALLRIDSALPRWVAPGALVHVGGFAPASRRVVLRTAAGRTLAAAPAGPRGRFDLRFRAPAPGRYRLRLAAAGATLPAGSLLVRPLVLAAVGDVTFGEQVGPAVDEHGGAYPWTGVARTLRAADLTVGNLETSISTRGVAAVKQYTFRGPPRALPAMSRLAGFDVLTLANNHAADYGPQALLDTIRYARAAGIQTIGAGASSDLARRPAFVEAGGLRVALLGYSDVNPLGFPATAWTPGTARADEAAITADVRAARRRADVVVCFLHWGVELRAEPDSRQRSLASACLDAGAKVVLGAHPHVFGAVERPGRRTLVAWTLGNFVFPSFGTPAQTGILEVRLGADGVRGSRVLPVRIDGFRPELVRGG